MSLWSRVAAWWRGETRSSLRDPALIELLGGRKATASGVSVSPDSALQVIAVYACVRIIAETIASLPFQLFRRVGDGSGRELARDHHLYDLLHDAPNGEMTSFSFLETTLAHLLLRGNSYAERELDGAGRTVALWPLPPTRVAPIRSPAGDLMYEVRLDGGKAQMLAASRVFHVHGLSSSDGVIGHCPITLARESIGLAMAAEEYAARFFGNGASPGGMLRHPGSVSPEAAKRLKTSWEEAHSGLATVHRTALLEEGMEWQRIGVDPEAAQLLETRRFQLGDIARLYRVPLHMLADLQNASYATVEQQGIDFETHTIRPWCVRIEREVARQLMTREERRRLFAELNIAGLLRGDIGSRYSAFATGRQNGWLSIDEIRSLENMNPLPGGLGTTYMVPMNMTQLGATAPEMKPPEEPPVPGGMPLVAKGNGEDA